MSATHEEIEEMIQRNPDLDETVRRIIKNLHSEAENLGQCDPVDLMDVVAWSFYEKGKVGEDVPYASGPRTSEEKDLIEATEHLRDMAANLQAGVLVFLERGYEVDLFVEPPKTTAPNALMEYAIRFEIRRPL